MAEDGFRDFRCGVAAPSEDARRRAAARLRGAIEDEDKPAQGIVSLVRRRPGWVIFGLAATTAFVTALFVSAPWKNSPGFLERAHAALAPPAETILHLKWESTSTSTDPACTVTRGPSEIWIDQAPPHRYRVLMNDLPPDPGDDARALACSSGTPSEIGGSLDTGETLRFVAPNTLTVNPARFLHDVDPVKSLREAISAGRAHDEGTTQLDGRTVQRIRIDPLPNCPIPDCADEPSYAYVDTETFYPVETRGLGGIVPPGGTAVPLRLVIRYLTFEYLPRTARNVALADIHAQHPVATP
jgi:hypothetical protein